MASRPGTPVETRSPETSWSRPADDSGTTVMP